MKEERKKKYNEETEQGDSRRMTETIANRMKPKFLKNDVLSITALEYYESILQEMKRYFDTRNYFVLTKMIAELKQKITTKWIYIFGDMNIRNS